ncbi:hypothetical protein [Corynebacterium imitans]
MLGATELGSHEAPGLVWTVMQDPERNKFLCRQQNCENMGYMGMFMGVSGMMHDSDR